MTWPLSQDYNEAIQSPASNFADPDLRGGQVALSPIGFPLPVSGTFADVYQVRGGDGHRWAVKCLTRAVPDLRERYQAISQHLVQARLPFRVDFTYLEQGIRAAGRWNPILKMQWVEGLTLNQFVAKYADKPAMLETLFQIWVRMGKYLRAADVAHGDLQHGNVLLVQGSGANSLALKLVDYDGMFVPGLASRLSNETGHPSYQHPRRAVERNFGLEMDRFPLLLVATALRALKTSGRALWEKYDNGDNILFKEADLLEPGESALFGELAASADPLTVKLTNLLRESLGKPLELVPVLDEVLREGKPASAIAKVVPPLIPEIVRLVPLPSERLHQGKRSGRMPNAILVAGATAFVLGLLVLFAAVVFSWQVPATEASMPPETVSGPQQVVVQAPKEDPPPLDPVKVPEVKPAPEAADKTAQLLSVQAPEAKPAAPPAPPDMAQVAEKPLLALATPNAPANAEPMAEKPARMPLPGAAELQAADKTVKEVHKAEYAKRKAADMVAFAKTLLREAAETKDNPAEQYVLFREARNVAARGDDLALSLKAASELARIFDVSPLEMKAQAAEAGCRADAGVSARAHAATLALGVAEEAAEEEVYEPAERLVRLAQATTTNLFSTQVAATLRAFHLKEVGLAAQARVGEIVAQRKAFEGVRAALEMLKGKPNDAAANLAVGKYHAFARGDWDRALMFLARGGDEALKALADADLAGVADAAGAAELADSYEKQGTTNVGAAKTALQSRAHFWHVQAAARSTGLTRAREEKKAAALEKVLLASYPVVLAAHYGARDGWVDVTETVRLRLIRSGGQRMAVHAREADLNVADPNFGETKAMVVVYRHLGGIHLSYAGQNDICAVPQPAGTLDSPLAKPDPSQDLHLLYARYGYGKNSNLVTTRLQPVVKGATFSGKPDEYTNDLDPQFGKYKSLVVVYRVDGRIHLHVSDAQKVVTFGRREAKP